MYTVVVRVIPWETFKKTITNIIDLFINRYNSRSYLNHKKCSSDELHSTYRPVRNSRRCDRCQLVKKSN